MQLKDPLSDISTNFDHSCLCLSRNNKFTILQTKTQKELYKYKFLKNIKIKFVRMYMLSNIIFIVEEEESNILWGKKVHNTLDNQNPLKKVFKNEIQDLKIISKNIYVLTGKKSSYYQDKKTVLKIDEAKIHIIDIFTYETLQEQSVIYFDDFIFDIPKKNEFYLGYNLPDSGELVLMGIPSSTKVKDAGQRKIMLHKNEKHIMIFKFNDKGNYLASLSKGTILKISKTNNEQICQKFWLNNGPVQFTSLAFTNDSQMLAAIEKKGKIYIMLFDKKKSENEENQNKTFLGKIFQKKSALDTLEDGLPDSQIKFLNDKHTLINYNKQDGVKFFKIFEDPKQNENTHFIDLLHLGYKQFISINSTFYKNSQIKIQSN